MIINLKFDEKIVWEDGMFARVECKFPSCTRINIYVHVVAHLLILWHTKSYICHN